MIVPNHLKRLSLSFNTLFCCRLHITGCRYQVKSKDRIQEERREVIQLYDLSITELSIPSLCLCRPWPCPSGTEGTGNGFICNKNVRWVHCPLGWIYHHLDLLPPGGRRQANLHSWREEDRVIISNFIFILYFYIVITYYYTT